MVIPRMISHTNEFKGDVAVLENTHVEHVHLKNTIYYMNIIRYC